MKAFKVKGYDSIELLLVLIALIAIGIGIFYVVKNRNTPNPAYGGGSCAGACGGNYTPPSYPTPTLQNTYQYSGFPFPNMPAGYTMIGKDDSQSASPEVDYVTDENPNQVTQDAVNLCKTHHFAVDNQQANGGSSQESSGNVTYSTYEVDCNGSNNQWVITYVDAPYIKYFQPNAPALTPQEQANVTQLTFVEITSDGTPVNIYN